MKIPQLSVFLVNEPGRLRACLDILTEADVNIVTLSLADTQDFGILRLITPDAERTKSILESHGYAIKTTEVVAIEVEDHPGGLSKVLDVVADAGVNVEYMYAFSMRSNKRAVMVFRFNDPDSAVAALHAQGINPLASVALT